MFRDTDQELKRLEQALLEEEEEKSTPDTQGTAVFNPISEKKSTVTAGYQAYNTDQSDEDLETYSETVRKADRSISLLSIVLGLLALLILGTVALVLLRYLGVL